MTTSRKVAAAAVSAVRPPDGSLVPTERDVLTGRLRDLDREDKHRRDDDVEHGGQLAPATGPAPAPRPRLPRWAVVAAGAAVVVVVAGGVAVATGALGGGDATSQASGPGGGPSGDGGGPGDVAPELDPAQVVGYAMTSMRTLFEGGPGIEPTELSRVGSTQESEWTCSDGECRNGRWLLHVGESMVEIELEEPRDAADPCAPVMRRLELTLGDDGSYAGTASLEPAHLFFDSGSYICYEIRYVDEVVLVPILAD